VAGFHHLPHHRTVRAILFFCCVDKERAHELIRVKETKGDAPRTCDLLNASMNKGHRGDPRELDHNDVA
jgi:hypothetical protein